MGKKKQKGGRGRFNLSKGPGASEKHTHYTYILYNITSKLHLDEIKLCSSPEKESITRLKRYQEIFHFGEDIRA